jgi:single stranded DNA-binding protein
MINEAQVFLAGYVAREPKFRVTSNGVSVASLRVGYTPRRVDRETGEWADMASSFVTVICWRGLADNVATCLRKGEPVLVKGRLQVRPYDKDGVSRLAVEIEASSVGYDLARGVANFQRSRRSPGEPALGRPAAGEPDGLPGPPAGPGAPYAPGGPDVPDELGVPGELGVPEAYAAGGGPAGDGSGERGLTAPPELAGGNLAGLASEEDDEGLVAPAGLTAPF